jgi:hypothetical protein
LTNVTVVTGTTVSLADVVNGERDETTARPRRRQTMLGVNDERCASSTRRPGARGNRRLRGAQTTVACRPRRQQGFAGVRSRAAEPGGDDRSPELQAARSGAV